MDRSGPFAEINAANPGARISDDKTLMRAQL